MIAASSQFHRRAERGELTVAVVGLGFTGLPLAQATAAAGFRTLGVEISPERVAALRDGRSYVPDVSDAALAEVADRLTITEDISVVAEADAVLVCVSTPLGADDKPDLTQLDAALRSVGDWLAEDALLILQSTMPVGTTRRAAGRLADQLNRKVGERLYVSCSPERVNPSDHAGWSIHNTPRVVGGCTPACGERADALLSAIGIPVVAVSSPEVAEMSKLVENTARLVNISLANEIADLCAELELPVAEVIGAAATKPFGFLPHWPGPGVGGECIPVDPVFLLATQPDGGERLLPLVSTARRQAQRQPAKVLARVEQLLDAQQRQLAGTRVLLLGVAYKPEVPDARNAPALTVLSGLRRLGIEVSYCDPFIPALQLDGERYTSLDIDDLEMDSWDCVVLMTLHSCFVETVKLGEARCVLDCSSTLPRNLSLHHL